MSLYSRGAMRSSSQNSATWGPLPIFQLPPINGAGNSSSSTGSILDGSLFLPPNLPSKFVNTGDLEMEVDSEVEFSEDQDEESGNREEETTFLTDIDVYSDSLQGEAGFASSNRSQAQEQTARRTTQCSGEDMPSAKDTAEFDTDYEQGTDSELERMSPIRGSELDLISANLQRSFRPFTNGVQRPELHYPEHELPQWKFDCHEKEDTREYSDMILEDPTLDRRTVVYSYRGVSIPITEESHFIQETLGSFHWPVSKGDVKKETQPVELFPRILSGSDVIFTESPLSISHEGETSTDQDQNAYLTEIDEDDGGVAVGEVKTRYQEINEIQASFRDHPVIRQWNISKFMEEWAREDGLVEHILELESRMGTVSSGLC